MLLSLSSAAAPRLPLAALLEGCGRRGLAGLELSVGDAHGVEPATAAEALRLAEAVGVRLAGVRCAGFAGAGAALPLAARLGAPLVVDAAALSTPQLCALAWVAAGSGVRILLLHGSDLTEARRVRTLAESLPPGTAGTAWEVDPARDDGAAVPQVLREAGEALAYVRLRGGGPESAAQTGMGVGALMARLTLARYGGPLVLSPSTSGHRQVWERWLGRAGGWGCGSRQSSPELVTLAGAAS